MISKSTKIKTLSCYLGVMAINFIFILLSITCNVYADTYSHSMDRFEVVGNLPGNFVDDFDDGILNPAWEDFRGTVTESGGVLTLSSPGAIFSVQASGLLLSIEDSIIESNGLTVQDGSGDFTGTSTWLPDLPEMNQWFNMGVHHDLGPDLTEDVSIGVINIDSDIAAAFGFPAGGTAMLFGKVIADGSSDDVVVDLNFQAFLIDPANVTGNILLQLAFDDTSNQFSGRFSLDGGATFQSEFIPVSPSAVDTSYIWNPSASSLRIVSEFIDSDNDEIPDILDNCIDVWNPEQKDANSGEDDNPNLEGMQHYGNACDTDYNNNGFVGLEDFNELRAWFGQSVLPAPAYIDCDSDNIIGLSDFNCLRTYFGQIPGPGIGD